MSVTFLLLNKTTSRCDNIMTSRKTLRNVRLVRLALRYFLRFKTAWWLATKIQLSWNHKLIFCVFCFLSTTKKSFFLSNSWCFSPEGIRKKLLDAPKSDYPRYGDDVAKTQVDYIKRLIKHGILISICGFSRYKGPFK